MLLERINCYQNKRMSLQFSIKILDQLQAPYISTVGPKILQYNEGMTQLTSLVKNLYLTKV